MKVKKFYLRIRSRHPSHSFLRRNKELRFPTRSILRLGSVTSETEGIELNTIQAVNNSKDKKRMKELFLMNNIPTPRFYIYNTNGIQEVTRNDRDLSLVSANLESLNYPIISKNRFGSRGLGNLKHDNVESLRNFIQNKKNRINNYIFEEYCNYCREYRVHVSDLGMFHIVRKLRRNGTEKRWVFNNETCAWILPENPSFNTPSSLDAIALKCKAAKDAVGLTIGALDVRVNKKGDFSIIEINSAPCLDGEVIGRKFIDELKKLIT